MVFVEINVQSLDSFNRALEENKGKAIFVYFTGTKDAKGLSWCPDCVKAEPIVRAELSKLPEGSIFIYCQTGDKSCWKDPNNVFRKSFKLSSIPTLLKYGTPQKLVEEELLNSELVQMLFTED
ncbi:thioredoxin domain-containing protein 17 [Callorhinchus milii]|uniref:Thioredoxin domain-containing protein 17 n=2 Tax=Callorhinchus milii TaxID=7868 RepID=K4FT49_CALMI|nr:thioredoxin domain-containing protein 17 [Callorhinchus milii]AFK10895.1 Thioredoxin-like protein 5 [Callorhinchus milii]|eukprot:gi/632988109/ref/XP_007882927.1/ PREDICTED: thioredoxin domain-containing protein 17 [Callorhinchus milii]